MENTENEQIFKQETQQQIDQFLQGYSQNIFLHGETGSGKTYTLCGNKDQKGIMHFSVAYILKQLQQNKEFQLQFSAVQIYQNFKYDLLKSPEISIREESSQIIVQDYQEFQQYLDISLQNKIKRETIMNQNSSRSHTIFQFKLTKVKQNQQNCLPLLQFIDLAGHESIKIHYSTQLIDLSAIEESKSINKSLYFLGRMVEQMGKKVQDNVIDFRNCQLTRFLKKSFEENSQITFIYCLDIKQDSLKTNLNLLQFCQRVKKLDTNFCFRTKHSLYQSHNNSFYDSPLKLTKNIGDLFENEQINKSLNLQNLQSELLTISYLKNFLQNYENTLFQFFEQKQKLGVYENCEGLSLVSDQDLHILENQAQNLVNKIKQEKNSRLDQKNNNIDLKQDEQQKQDKMLQDLQIDLNKIDEFKVQYSQLLQLTYKQQTKKVVKKQDIVKDNILQPNKLFSEKRSSFNMSKTLKRSTSKKDKSKKKTLRRFMLGYKENYTVSQMLSKKIFENKKSVKFQKLKKLFN